MKNPTTAICKSCGEPFAKLRPMQRGCSLPCEKWITWDRQNKAAIRADRKSDRERRVALKTKSDWIKDAQREFNRYIRLRDARASCICCGGPLDGGGAVGGYYDCGHYRSIGSAPQLRFDEENAHGQRKQCNRYQAGRAVDYRLGLIARCGIEVVERLERDNSVTKWSIDDLKAIRDKYRQKAKELAA